MVAVFRRGPSQWAQVGRWDLAEHRYEPGAWLRGRIFPRRSDISPDGRWLCYFAHNPKARWEHGEAYVAVSKLPWLTALYVFGTCGTWTRGYYFKGDRHCEVPGDRQLPIPYGLAAIPVEQFANERRRGWIDSPDSPARSTGGPWDENRNARLQKLQPRGSRILHLESLGRAGGEFGGQAIDGLRVAYALESDGDFDILEDAQWADWDAQGRLLVATRSGRLQIRELRQSSFNLTFEADLSEMAPEAIQPPDWAQRW